jgi:hypothetical protein
MVPWRLVHLGQLRQGLHSSPPLSRERTRPFLFTYRAHS